MYAKCANKVKGVGNGDKYTSMNVFNWFHEMYYSAKKGRLEYGIL